MAKIKIDFSSTQTYPEDIMNRIRQSFYLDEEDSSSDGEFMELPQDDILDRVLDWEGIIGYGDMIRQFILDIYEVNLSEMTYKGISFEVIDEWLEKHRKKEESIG